VVEVILSLDTINNDLSVVLCDTVDVDHNEGHLVNSAFSHCVLALLDGLTVLGIKDKVGNSVTAVERGLGKGGVDTRGVGVRIR